MKEAFVYFTGYILLQYCLDAKHRHRLTTIPHATQYAHDTSLKGLSQPSALLVSKSSFHLISPRPGLNLTFVQRVRTRQAGDAVCSRHTQEPDSSLPSASAETQRNAPHHTTTRASLDEEQTHLTLCDRTEREGRNRAEQVKKLLPDPGSTYHRVGSTSGGKAGHQ